MHQVTADNIRSGDRIHQFHGKWPFTRFMGMQEPASVLFSVLNGWAHYRGYRRLQKEVTKTSPWRRYYMINSLMAINGWVWSVIFHSRDKPWTEKLDYFSAVGSITFSAYISLVKALDLILVRKWLNKWVGLAFLVFYTIHVTYLTFWPFDYSYNMIAGVSMGMLSNITWLSWCFTKRKSRKYVWKMAATVILIMIAMSFELFDFPPVWWIFDAHSLWHGFTWPIIFLYYDFFVDDAKYEVKKRFVL
jgi:hypothetical protein